MRNRIWNKWAEIAGVALVLVGLAGVPAFAASEGTFERNLNVNGPVMLEVQTGSGDIHVQTGGAGQVHVVGHIKANNWWGGGDAEQRVQRIQSNPPIQQSGNDIRIGHIDDPALRHNISISYEIVVPANTKLEAHTGSGNQRVEGIEGRADLESGSGDVEVANIGDAVHAQTGSGNITISQVKGNVRSKTGSGDIRATGVSGGFEGSTGSGNVTLQQTASGAVRVDTGSGGVELQGVHGSLEAQAGSGDIKAEGDPSGSWSVHTGSGGVRLTLASSASYDLSARTSSGSIVVNQPVTVQGVQNKHELQGKVRGGGVPVEVETGSGDIEIQ